MGGQGGGWGAPGVCSSRPQGDRYHRFPMLLTPFVMLFLTCPCKHVLTRAAIVSGNVERNLIFVASVSWTSYT